ncbi:probable cytochrome P450 6a23 isoform X2 [Aethina tumida]|uniref:probable cytochrome P450 6a23 isoform X2 n=1 Tax=Aethina tumida TaxID=116153 RepID=UPI0021493B7E|nr:probable cytochrome P450 6a23 isoform X2 [Aethina tumida]
MTGYNRANLSRPYQNSHVDKFSSILNKYKYRRADKFKPVIKILSKMFTFLPEIVLFLVTIVLLVLGYFKYSYTYWSRRGIPFIKPKLFYGNLKSLPKGVGMGLVSKTFHEEFRRMKVRYGGLYGIAQPILMVVDLDFIKDIFIKDFQYFVNRGMYHNETADPLSSNLLTQEDQKWKNLRIKFTPTFTTGKMKNMFSSMNGCAQRMLDYMESSDKQALDAKNVMQRYTIDVIGTTVFGISCDSFAETSDFRRMARRIFEVDFRSAINFCLALYCPTIAKYLGVTLTSRDVREFFFNVVASNVKYREQTNTKRSDFFQMLVDLKNAPNKEDSINLTEITAQTFLFFLGGFETSSSTMMFCTFELAHRQEIQDRLRKEIREVLNKYNQEINYESIQEMKYLSQVLDETLRLYPLVPTLTRRCTQNYKIKGTEDVIEKGTMVLISTFGIHRDPEIWHDPLEFDPERFSDENKKNQHPCAFIPFGDGPRNCIGMRFGLLQTKIGLAHLLKNYKFYSSPKTKLPLEFQPETFVLFTVNDIYFKVEKLQQ